MTVSSAQGQVGQSGQAGQGGQGSQAQVSSLTDEHKAALKIIGIGSNDDFTQVENFIAAIGIGNTEADQEKVSALFRGIAGDIYSRMDAIQADAKSDGGLTAAEFLGGDEDYEWFNSLFENHDIINEVDGNALPANFSSSLRAIAQQVVIPETSSVGDVITLLKGMFSGPNFELAQALATSIGANYQSGGLIYGLTLNTKIGAMGGKVPNTETEDFKASFGDDWQQLTNLADVLANGLSDGLFGLDGKGDDECLGLEANESCKIFVDLPGKGWVLNMPALMRTRTVTDADGNEIKLNLFKDVFDELRDSATAGRTCMDGSETPVAKDKCEANDYLNQAVKDLDEADFSDKLSTTDKEISTTDFLSVMKAVNLANTGDDALGLTDAEWTYLLKGDNDGLSEIFAKYYGDGSLTDQREEFVNDLFVVALPWKLTPQPYKDDFDTIMKNAKSLDEAADEVTDKCC